jgi:F0F1-type ATP synthase membrane subunit c/vacuolar-type H+-ATPase subunit K
MKRIAISIIFLFVFIKSFGIVQAQTISSFEFDNFTDGSDKVAGLPFQVTLTAKDEFDAVLTTFNQDVNLSDTTNSIYPTQTGANFVNGVWTGDVYITTSQDDISITASYNLISDMSTSFDVNPDTRIKFATSRSGTNQVGSVSSLLPQSLTVRVSDPYGNALSNVGVNFAITSAPPLSTGQSLSNNSATTNSSGDAATSLTLGQKAGTYIVSSSINTANASATHFYATATAGALFSLQVIPAVAVVPGGSMVPFSAVGYDQYTNQVSLNSLTWSIENGGGTIDTTGIFYAGTTLGNYSNTVKATVGSIGTTASVSIVGTSGSGTATGSTLVATPIPTTNITPIPQQEGFLYDVRIDPSVISALENARIPIVAEGVDLTGQTVSDVTYTFTVEGGLGTITQTGPASALLTVGQAGLGAVTVTATQGDRVVTGQVIGSVGNGINRRLVIEDVLSPQRVGEPFTLSIAAKDTANNFVTDYEGPLVLADTTGTIDPATVQPSQSGIWYVQAVINLSHPEVSITAAGDGMVGVSNIFEVIGEPAKGDVGPGLGGLGQGVGEVLGASISAIIDQLLLEEGGRYAILRYIGSGLAAGFGILGAAIGGGIMVSRGLEAIGRNPYAKGRLQVNLYASISAFVIAASLAVFAAFLILR